MFHRGLKLFLTLVLRVFFRKVYFSGASLLPADGPLILACNHPNSFLDALILAVLLPRTLHFLARADAFNSPFKRWLLTRLHLVPIYRLEEGAENLRRNEETFARCYDILKNKGAILIFSEGVCVLEKRLRPLRKGTARLAFGAEANQHFKLGLQVVPVGLNYTYPSQFRREVMIGLGTPIPVRVFEPVYAENPAKAMLQFNQLLARELEKNIIHIKSSEQETIAEYLFRLSRAGSPDFLSASWFSTNRSRLQAEIEIARNLEGLNMAADLPVESDTAEAAPKRRRLAPSGTWLLPGLPVVLVGLAFNVVPMYLAVLLTRNKVRKREFYASVLMVAGMLVYPGYWFILSATAIALLGWPGLGISGMVPLSGYLALLWWDKYRLFRLAREARHPLTRYPVKAQRLQQPIR